MTLFDIIGFPVWLHDPEIRKNIMVFYERPAEHKDHRNCLKTKLILTSFPFICDNLLISSHINDFKTKKRHCRLQPNVIHAISLSGRKEDSASAYPLKKFDLQLKKKDVFKIESRLKGNKPCLMETFLPLCEISLTWA